MIAKNQKAECQAEKKLNVFFVCAYNVKTMIFNSSFV